MHKFRGTKDAMDFGIYAHNDYKKWLNAYLELHPGRGEKARLADAAGCQRSFLSQVLHGSAHLTLDQAIGLAEGLRLDESATAYIEAMVGSARASTRKLQTYYKRRMQKIAETATKLSTRLKQPQVTAPEIAMGYYASWEYAVVHMLLTIPAFQTVEAITAKTSLAESHVELILERLRVWRLVERSGSSWRPLVSSLHIPVDHPMGKVHHRNFRLFSMAPRVQEHPEAFQYSAVYSLDAKCLEALRSLTMEFIDKTRVLVSPAVEQDAVVFNVDLLPLR